MPERYLGIDVGFADADPTTGLCLITLDRDCLQWECRNSTTDEGERLDDLRSLIRNGKELTGVGIDGPLAHDLNMVCHFRAAEALITGATGYVFKTRCQPASSNSKRGKPLRLAAKELAELAVGSKVSNYLNIDDADHCDAVHKSRTVETFPDAFLAFLLADNDFENLPSGKPGRKKSDKYWEVAVDRGYLHKLIKHMAPVCRLEKPLARIKDHDRRAAFICALSAMCVARNRYVAVGDQNSGDIILPPVKTWGRGPDGQPNWAEELLRRKVDSVHQILSHESHSQARVISNGQCWLPRDANAV